MTNPNSSDRFDSEVIVAGGLTDANVAEARVILGKSMGKPWKNPGASMIYGKI